jgi:hypothetical protein
LTTRRFVSLILTLVIAFVLSACAAPETQASPQSAVLSELQGAVEARQAGDDHFISASNGYVLNENGQVQTGDDGKTRLDLSTGSIIRVGPSSLFTLVSNTPQAGSLDTQASLEAGQVWIILNGGQIDVQTPSGQASVRGSRMGIGANAEGGVRVTCLEGTCSFQNETGIYAIPPGSVLVCAGPNDVPTITPMSALDVQEWLEVDSGAVAFVPALTAAAATPTAQPTATPTPTAVPPTPTPTPSPVPTFATLTGVVTADSLSCRYGPGAVYLFEYSFIKGNKVEVLGRADTTAGAWIYVKFNNILKPCWVNTKYIELSGDASSLEPVYPDKAPLILFHHANFPPPKDVTAKRNGDQVEIDWTGYELAPGDRESQDSPLYLVEVWTCQEGKVVFTPIGAFVESALVQDQTGCAEPSHGQVFLAHKDGYVGPVAIPWPAP